MGGRGTKLLVAFAGASIAVGMVPIHAVATDFDDLACTAALGVTTCTGHLGLNGTGAAYIMQVPANWNHTLLLYSHGYVTPGSANPARDVGDPATGAFLLSHGYALAGSSYAGTGWALQEAFSDQIATLDKFAAVFAAP